MGERCWAIVRPDGKPVWQCAAHSRRGAIHQMTGPEEGWQKRWQSWRKNGFTAVRCIITIVPEAPDAD